MNPRHSLFAFLVLTIIGLLTVGTQAQEAASKPPPPSTHILKLLSPNENVTYYVNNRVHVHLEFVGGKNNPLYKNNADIKFSLQRRITYPALNAHVLTAKARDLYNAGEAVFTIEKSHIIEKQKTIPNRVRASWDGGYSDSKAFWLKR
ncbi:hypothetical protein BGZ94_006003, partial [Podila epigama]